MYKGSIAIQEVSKEQMHKAMQARGQACAAVIKMENVELQNNYFCCSQCNIFLWKAVFLLITRQIIKLQIWFIKYLTH